MLKIKESAKFDIVSLGEVMLRLDPGDYRIKQTSNFRVFEGGGEYNVARGLQKVFGKKGAIITGIVNNEVGALLKNLIDTSGLNTDYIVYFADDGIGASVRNSVNWTEKGFGIRGAKGVSDRANGAASKIKISDVNLDKLFKKDGVRLLHTGGIYTALSEQSANFAIEVIKKAKENGTIVSYDLNYRPSLWKRLGGIETAQKVNRKIAKYVDIMIGNEEDFFTALGIKIDKSSDELVSTLNLDTYKSIIKKASSEFNNFEIIATTLRKVKTATVNDWSALCWSKHDGLIKGRSFDNLEIYDRVGGGDSFASGFIYGILENKELLDALNYGIVHGAFAMTTAGDTSQGSLQEIEKIVNAKTGSVARVDR